MTDIARDSPVTSVLELLKHYGFDCGESTSQQLIDQWLQAFPVQWIRQALIEALYQGRYKAVSVEQLLTSWQRRGQPIYHFNHEFERLVCHRFPRKLANYAEEDTAPVKRDTRRSKAIAPTHLTREEQLPAAEQKRVSSSSLPGLEVASRARNPARIHTSVERNPRPVELTPARLPNSPSRNPALGSPKAPSWGHQVAETPPSPPVTRDEPPYQLSREPLRQTISHTHATQVATAHSSGASAASKIGTAKLQPDSGLGEAIHRFIPLSKPSGFCAKLTAIALADRVRNWSKQKV